jgi:hypothetical protein
MLPWLWHWQTQCPVGYAAVVPFSALARYSANRRYSEPHAARTEAPMLHHCPTLAMGSVWYAKGALQKFCSPTTIRATTAAPNWSKRVSYMVCFQK